MSRPPKKSDVIEVRISHEDKQRLRAKAASDGLSLSAAVRRLIADYLREDDAAERETHSLLDRFIMPIKRYPARIAAGTAALLAAALTLAVPAHAEERSLALSFETVTPEDDGTRTRSGKTVVTVDDYASFCMSLDTNEMCGGPDDLVVEGRSLLVEIIADGPETRFEMKVRNGPDVLAEPSITIKHGGSGSIEIADVAGTTIRFEAETLAEVVHGPD